VRVGETGDGQRIDNFLARTLKGVPKDRIYRLLRRGEVRVNRARVKPDFRLNIGDDVRLPPVDLPVGGSAPTPGPNARALLREIVLFEDDGLLVLDKPSGMAVHGGSGVSLGVIEMLRGLRPDAPFLELAHRLDRETSGCLLIAKRRSVLRRLHEAMRNGRIGKEYLCLVRDPWLSATRIDARLRRGAPRSGERLVRIDDEDGKASVTLFTPVDHWSHGGWGGSLVRARLVTGRTHQIRVHAAGAGHPLAGDDKYGDREFNQHLREIELRRMFLHAAKIVLPAGVAGPRLEISAPLPRDLASLLARLGLTDAPT